jgi:hypothetical protein
MDKLVYHGGPILRNCIVQPIFWGSAWNAVAVNQTALELTSDLARLVAGPYMLGLSQYQNIAPATVLAAFFDPSSEPASPFTLAGLGAYIKTLLTPSARIPDYRANDQLLYVVFASNVTLMNYPNASGFHYFDELGNQTFHYAWVGFPRSEIASHEIIEACTDPEATGYLQPGNGIEVGDICELNPDAYGPSDGIVAAAYWSNLDSKCILPRRAAKVTVGTPETDGCPIGPTIGNKSTFSVSIELEPSWIDGSKLPVLNYTYAWTYDATVAKQVSMLNESKLTLEWTGSTGAPVFVGVTINDQGGRVLASASVAVTVKSLSEATVLLRGCLLRKFVESVKRIPPFLIHKLGPDPVSILTEVELEELRLFARGVTKRVERIAALNEETML